MAHYGTLRDFAFQKDVDDIRGTAVYGFDDDKLGKIDDVIFDHGSGEIRYVVIDTGGWLSSKKFLVPADRIHARGKDDTFAIDMSKDRIEREFPPYSEKSLESEHDWKDYEDRYKKAWDEAPVQHREGRIDLNITPETVTAGTSPTGVASPRHAEVGGDTPRGSLGEELTDEYAASDEERALQDDNRISGSRTGDVTPQRLAGKFPETLQSGDKLHMTPAGVPERDLPQTRVANESMPNRSWQDDPTGSEGRRQEVGVGRADRIPVESSDQHRTEVHRAGAGEWHPRMRRFEDVLRKNRVDVTASCASCSPAKDKAA